MVAYSGYDPLWGNELLFFPKQSVCNRPLKTPTNDKKQNWGQVHWYLILPYLYLYLVLYQFYGYTCT